MPNVFDRGAFDDLPPKWTLRGIFARLCMVFRRPADVFFAVQMGFFLCRASLALTRESRAGHLRWLGLCRRPQGIDASREREDLERLLRVSYIYVRFFETHASCYLRALNIHRFSTSVVDAAVIESLEMAMMDVRRGKPCSIALIDADRLGRLGDRFGWDFCGGLLANIARVIEKTVADAGVWGRFGGDEFLVILPDVSPTGALQIIDAVRDAVASSRLNGTPAVTVSAGLVHVQSDAAVAEVMELVEQTLQSAKKGGRNRVAVYAPHGEGPHGFAIA